MKKNIYVMTYPLLLLLLTNCVNTNNLVMGSWVYVANFNDEIRHKYSDSVNTLVCNNPYHTKYFFSNDFKYLIDMGDVNEKGKFYQKNTKLYLIDWKNDTLMHQIIDVNNKEMIIEFPNKSCGYFLKCE